MKSAALLFVFSCLPAFAQNADPAPPPQGQVLFQSHGDVAIPTPVDPAQASTPAAGVPDITDTERAALRFTAYDLDARLTPASSRLDMRAHLTLRNDGAAPLTHLALQISSSLTWDSVTLLDGKARTRLPLAQHLLDTDADHTGKAREAILTLPAPLAPSATLELDTFYSGTITQDATRLERIGIAPAAAADADWDAITASSVALRGFGDVLWYPVASPQLFLGEGAQLFDAIGQSRLRDAATTVHLRLSVDYLGDPPAAAYFCGRRKAFTATSDNADAPVVSSPGLAIADFPAAPLGFRTLSLFLAASPETLVPATRDATSTDPLLAIETDDDALLPVLGASAKDAAVVLQEWLGLQPLSALTLLDHPGQPFEDGPLLVVPVAAIAAADAMPALTHSLAHAWIQTGIPWMDEGLAQFFVLLGVERVHGREAAEAQLEALTQPLGLTEPAITADKPAPVGQPLPSATSEVFYRRKAAAVWWMLRALAGDDALKSALQAWRLRPASRNTPTQEALIFEAELEKASSQDLHWFFDDWVLHDRGLPDLTIVDVTPRELTSSNGRSNGWLVSVTVRNDGAAVADVPVTVQSGPLHHTARIRIPGFSTATQRIVIEAQPTSIAVNDGVTPEQRSSLHKRDILLRTR